MIIREGFMFTFRHPTSYTLKCWRTMLKKTLNYKSSITKIYSLTTIEAWVKIHLRWRHHLIRRG